MHSEEVLALFRKMVEARRFEEKAAELYTQGHIRGFCHLYIGQEAVIVGVAKNIKYLQESPLDSVITSYRDHAHMLTLGVDPRIIMAELCGKEAGCSKGKGGSMHMYSKPLNFYGGNGIVGAQVSIGTGLALAHKYNNDGGVALIFYGDGAANQGQVYESFNMAALWKLPAVYVLENNRYALGTSIPRAVAGNSLINRGDPFGIPTIIVDGMDVFDVIDKSREAIDYARSGNGPIILHMDTYRYRGHSMSDPGTYRPRSEIEQIKKERDPIVKIKSELLTTYNVSPEEIERIEEEAERLMKTAAEFAINAEEADVGQLETDIILS
ncbi:MAG: pyruvate dehydrogenase (acetyl-transferring) E1 component subunit alpha [Holosporales bacterium]|jgi:pyruvate dehydrogenase E1 component alpha subunit|nr:pyruvate dehydrogenase (acetyl-transferring) E1 component subunit alpha [Holosporales bacterium]